MREETPWGSVSDSAAQGLKSGHPSAYGAMAEPRATQTWGTGCCSRPAGTPLTPHKCERPWLSRFCLFLGGRVDGDAALTVSQSAALMLLLFDAATQPLDFTFLLSYS